jgi:hypothetical protein
MRKTTAKLALRKETIRELSRKELSRAAGGADTDDANAVAQSRDKQCLAAAAAGG